MHREIENITFTWHLIKTFIN